MIIRDANTNDLTQILSIYAPYVEKTAITFEYDVPSLADFANRLKKVQEKFPWLVAEDENGKIIGYAYASTFKPRAAYQWSIETSIYVDINMHRGGIGKALHTELENRLKAQGILNMNACISYIDVADEYLNQDSVRFHERMGYNKVAHFHVCGKKFGRWYDMIWMEKLIGEHKSDN